MTPTQMAALILQRRGWNVLEIRAPVPSQNQPGFVKFDRGGYPQTLGIYGVVKIFESISNYHDVLIEQIAEAEREIEKAKDMPPFSSD